MELYSLKFEIDFGVITDRGVFIEEILAEIVVKSTLGFYLSLRRVGRFQIELSITRSNEKRDHTKLT